jgi:putative ABC transport system ATP-binding protein
MAVVKLLASEIKQRGKAGIMVTHDLRMVEFTDRTLRILDGRLDDEVDTDAEHVA